MAARVNHIGCVLGEWVGGGRDRCDGRMGGGRCALGEWVVVCWGVGVCWVNGWDVLSGV